MPKKITAVVQFKNGEVYEYDSIWNRALERGDCIKVTGKDAAALLHAYRQGKLLALIKPKDTVYTVCVQSNASTSHYKVLITATSDEGRNYIRDITRDVADLVGHKISDKSGGIVMGGYGYSKSFQIVYGLGLTLWPNGTDEPHGVRNGEPDSNGGYALQQQSL